jgi:serine/threonine protein kinase
VCITVCSVPGGELFQHIDVDGRIDEKTAVRLMKQILSGVSFLHANNILHLDIKV